MRVFTDKRRSVIYPPGNSNGNGSLPVQRTLGLIAGADLTSRASAEHYHISDCVSIHLDQISVRTLHEILTLIHALASDDSAVLALYVRSRVCV